MWSYIDSDSGALRTLDIVASRSLFEFETETQPRVRPRLDLLIECKQSDLPFIFFSSVAKPWLREFPSLAGLANETIVITTDDDRSTWNESVMSAFELGRHPFVGGDIEFCMSMSKFVRKGKVLELSGSEPFQSIVLPMVKAVRHFKRHERPPETARYFDCHLAVPIVVIDAPMISARLEGNTTSLRLKPWVRVARHEAVESDNSSDRTQTFGIDIVHKSYFETYLQQHVIPFARTFAGLAIKHQIELATGKAFATGMGADSFRNIEARLKPRR